VSATLNNDGQEVLRNFTPRPNETDLVCERALADYVNGLANWNSGALSFAEHFYQQMIDVTNGAEKWVTALNLVRAELVYRKLAK